MRSRPSDAFVALAATLASVLGLTTLTTTPGWLATSVWSCLAVALVGIGMRRLTGRGWLVLLGQVVLVGWFVIALFARSSLWFGLPGSATMARLGELGADVSDVLQKYAAPIPSTPGIEFLFVASVTVLALAVDYLGVTRSAPAAAGLPLLGAFLTAAANSGSSLAPGYFLVAALFWLILVSRQASSSVRRWSTTIATPRTPTSSGDSDAAALGGFGTTARQLGAVALIAAVVLPAVIPHLPTRFILDGLGRNDSAVGNGGRVGFNSTLDLTRSLQNGSLNPVLTYRTSAAGPPPPLRVVVTSDYVGGQWRTSPGAQPTDQTLVAASKLSVDVPVQDRTFSVNDNTLEAPHIAAPQPVVAADFGGTPWGADQQTGDLFVRSRPDSYTLTYREVNVTGEQLRAGIPGGATGQDDPQVTGSLSLDPGSSAIIDDLAGRITQGTTTRYDAAVAIQSWFRGAGNFTYSLTLAPPAVDGNGQEVTDPITNFLITKQGYCVQFASAMIMMARARGIPARMAIGFLPGSLQDGQYTVRAADAHAWPELYFPGAGWLRFEPTPAGRTGSAPGYTAITTTPGNTNGPNRDPEASATATAAPSLGTNRKPDVDPTLGGTITTPLPERLRIWFSDPGHLVLLAIALGLLGSLVLPITARLVHRRRRLQSLDASALVEAQWAELVSRLTDLGFHPPDGGTLRDWRAHYTREAYLDDEAQESMGHVVSTLERTRYARPGRGDVDVRDDLRVITRAAAGSRPRTRRVQAFLFPGDGVAWWSRLFLGVTSAPGRWVDTLVDRLPRRR
ncbi:MAG: DUF3488 and transglutaminase-like domain-containing protein [Lapillicoccus sp.]